MLPKYAPNALIASLLNNIYLSLTPVLNYFTFIYSFNLWFSYPIWERKSKKNNPW